MGGTFIKENHCHFEPIMLGGLFQDTDYEKNYVVIPNPFVMTILSVRHI